MNFSERTSFEIKTFVWKKLKKFFEKYKNFELVFLSSYGRYRHVFDDFDKPQA